MGWVRFLKGVRPTPHPPNRGHTPPYFPTELPLQILGFVSTGVLADIPWQRSCPQTQLPWTHPLRGQRRPKRTQS